MKEFEELYSKIRHNSKWITPSKRYFAFVHYFEYITFDITYKFNYEYNYIVQFDSIDFLKGYEFIFIRAANTTIIHIMNDKAYQNNSLLFVFDSYKLCKNSVNYQILQKDNDDLVYVYNCLENYL